MTGQRQDRTKPNPVPRYEMTGSLAPHPLKHPSIHLGIEIVPKCHLDHFDLPAPTILHYPAPDWILLGAFSIE